MGKRPYGVNELRRSFLDFFIRKDHLAMKSFSLVPHNDNSLLLINAGMAPLKPYFTGQEVPPCPRVTTCQKCVRTGDIELVGKKARHLTFFEMLGNFSFGDYFKKEAIEYSWEYLTKVVGLDPDRMYASIYGEDEEAYRIWTEDIGLPPERISRFYRDPKTGKCDNFWEHGAGPCGPCSEVYYDRGEKYGCGRPDCGVGCDCDRFMEVWNDVFTQYNGDGRGHYEELATKNIDTGMGLERLAVVVQDVQTVFDIDTMKAIRDRVCAVSGKIYQADPADDTSIRLITDHIRSATFLVSDGVMPSNEGRGYVLRRLIRRAARHGRMLGIDGAFLADLSKTVIEENKDGYPELEEKRDFIFSVLTQEEEKFDRTIDAGLSILSDMMDRMKESGQMVLSGEDTFRLYDTYGFPVDLTEEILQEEGYAFDADGFASCMKQQRDRARSARKKTNYMGADETVFLSLDPSVQTEFVGYDRLRDESAVLFLTTETESVQALSDGQSGTLITERTPFYATMGGQQGDRGIVCTKEGTFAVSDTIRVSGGKYAHVGTVTEGMIRVGEQAQLCVDKETREKTCRNHSATHLLQKALREVLGTHVQQAGSYQDAERTRFDFTHFAPMTEEELSRVEAMVNEKIAEDLPVVTDVMDIEEARKTGAMALFGEKYGSRVRVVSMGDFSKEFCGGTHVRHTGEIMTCKILSESGIASGVRRIEALTGTNVLSYYKQEEQELLSAARLVKSTTADLTGKIKRLLADQKALLRENESLKSKAAQDALGDVMNQVRDVCGVSCLAAAVEGVDQVGLRDLGDQLKSKIEEGVIVLASAKDGRVSLIAMATDGAQKAGAHAGNLISAIAGKVGGGGGGRPNMAQAGGKNPDGIAEAISSVPEVLAAQLKH